MTETDAKPTAITATNGHHRLRQPLDLFEEMQQEFAQFWERSFPHLFAHRYHLPEHETWMPTLDAFESNGDFVIRAEIPGVDKDAIKVTVENGELVIAGERKSESEVKEEHYYRMERTFGSFYRRLPLPEGVTDEDVHAEYKDGILQIHMPKPRTSAAPAKQIPVK